MAYSIPATGMSATMCSANKDLSGLARGRIGSRAEKNAAASLQEVCNKGRQVR